MHSGLFGCLTKPGAKRAELVQKFVTQSRVGIFRNERTHSTPIGPRIHVLALFVLFGCIWDNCLPYETRCKMGGTSAKHSFPRSRIEIFRNERTLSSPLHPKVMFWCALYYLGAFGIVWLA